MSCPEQVAPLLEPYMTVWVGIRTSARGKIWQSDIGKELFHICSYYFSTSCPMSCVSSFENISSLPSVLPTSIPSCFLVLFDLSSSIHLRPRTFSCNSSSTIFRRGRCDCRHDLSPRRARHGPVAARELLRPHHGASLVRAQPISGDKENTCPGEEQIFWGCGNRTF